MIIKFIDSDMVVLSEYVDEIVPIVGNKVQISTFVDKIKLHELRRIIKATVAEVELDYNEGICIVTLVDLS